MVQMKEWSNERTVTSMRVVLACVHLLRACVWLVWLPLKITHYYELLVGDNFLSTGSHCLIRHLFVDCSSLFDQIMALGVFMHGSLFVMLMYLSTERLVYVCCWQRSNWNALTATVIRSGGAVCFLSRLKDSGSGEGYKKKKSWN